MGQHLGHGGAVDWTSSPSPFHSLLQKDVQITYFTYVFRTFSPTKEGHQQHQTIHPLASPTRPAVRICPFDAGRRATEQFASRLDNVRRRPEVLLLESNCLGCKHGLAPRPVARQLVAPQCSCPSPIEHIARFMFPLEDSSGFRLKMLLRVPPCGMRKQPHARFHLVRTYGSGVPLLDTTGPQSLTPVGPFHGVEKIKAD